MRYKRVEHVAIAVKSLDEVRVIFEDKLGLKLDYVESFPQYETKIAMYPVGETCIEFLEGTSDTSDPAKWIAKHGESLYHICLEVDDIDAALVELKAKGVRPLNETPTVGHGNSRVAFLDPNTTANILIELAELPAKHAPGGGADQSAE
jgi:methylmalonyl-CoA/ethylmalonyl-CoA epimerase